MPAVAIVTLVLAALIIAAAALGLVRVILHLVAIRKTLITLQGTAPNQNFFRLDLETGEQRQLTGFDLKSGSAVQNFDISPDGKHIVFDRLRNHADIVLMNLAR